MALDRGGRRTAFSNRCRHEAGSMPVRLAAAIHPHQQSDAVCVDAFAILK
jgi:hypothetical protein